MKVLIVEDEALTADRLTSMVNKYDPAVEICGVLPSTGDTVDWLKSNASPDLIFMDIHLEDDECFRIFEQTDIDTPVIFTTAFDEYMVKAFKVNSVDYLMKPVVYEDLVVALEKYKKVKNHYQDNGFGDLLQSVQTKEENYKERFLISNSFKLRTVETREINYFFCRDKVTFLVTTDGEFLPIEYSLDKLSLLLDPRQFFRINRQLIVSLPSITSIHVYPKGKLKVELAPVLKEEVYVSLDRATAFKEWLGK